MRQSRLDTKARRAGGKALPSALVAVALLAQGGLSLATASRGWFGVDALHYLVQRGGIGTPSEGLLEPYAGHWQTLVVLGYRMLYEMVGFDTYLPYVAPAVITHVAVCALLYWVCLRAGAPAWAAAIGVVALAFFGAGAEAFLADAPVALTSTVLLGLLATVALDRRGSDRRGTVVALLLLLAALMVSMASLTAVVFVAAFALARSGWRHAAVLLAVPAAVFATWFLAIGRSGDRVSPEAEELLRVPELAFSLLTAPLGSIVPVPGAGFLLTALVVAAPLVGSAAGRGLRDLALAGLVAAVTQSVLSGLASVQLGDGAVLVGRYQYVVLAFLLPAVVVALGEVAAAVRGRVGELSTPLVVVLAVCLLGALVGNGLEDQRQRWQLTRAEAEKAEAWTKGGVAAVALGERMLNPDGAGYTLHGHDIQGLAAAGAARWSSLAATPEDRLAAESQLFVGVGPDSYGLTGPARLETTSFDQPLAPDGDCRQATATRSRPEISLVSFQGAQIAVESEGSTITTVLERDGVLSEPREWAVVPGQATYVATTAQLATLRLFFPQGGLFTICSA